MGTIKHYLREIRDLDPQWHAETARLNALQFADLDEKDKLQTPTPSFLPDVRACQSPGMSGSVMSMSGGPSVSVLDRPLTSSPCSSVPPRVTTLEEYNAYRRQNGAERPLSPAQRQINKDHIAGVRRERHECHKCVRGRGRASPWPACSPVSCEPCHRGDGHLGLSSPEGAGGGGGWGRWLAVSGSWGRLAAGGWRLVVPEGCP